MSYGRPTAISDSPTGIIRDTTIWYIDTAPQRTMAYGHATSNRKDYIAMG